MAYISEREETKIKANLSIYLSMSLKKSPQDMVIKLNQS